MTKTFFLKIRMGNGAMQTAEDLAESLIDTARRINDHRVDIDDGFTIRDTNGNRIGDAGFTVDGDPE